jgi:drug/metabolite transporter (DMT)-like permease
MKDSSSGHFGPTALAACAGFWICWSIGPIYIKLLSGPLDVWTQNAARYAVACVFWLPFLILYGRQKITRAILLRALIPTGFNLAMQSCWAGAFYYEQPAFMVLLSRTSVLWVGLFSLIFFVDERRLFKSPVFWTGAILALTGLAGVIVSSPRFEMAATWKGIALALGASLGWAAYAISVKIVFKGVDSRLSFFRYYDLYGIRVKYPGRSVRKTGQSDGAFA